VCKVVDAIRSRPNELVAQNLFDFTAEHFEQLRAWLSHLQQVSEAYFVEISRIEDELASKPPPMPVVQDTGDT
jgi:hypothetical protein